MSWLKIDDQFIDHPKVIGLSLEALGLWIHGLVYCGRNMTDGVVPAGLVHRALAGASPTVVAELVDSGLWESHPETKQYVVHDYLQYNKSRAEQLAEREARSEAGRRGGHASAVVRGQAPASSPTQPTSKQSSSKPEANLKQNPTPVPVPLKEIDKSISLVRFEEWWSTYPRKKVKTEARKAWLRMSDEDQQACIIQSPRHYPQYANREERFTPHPSTWINQKRWEDEPVSTNGSPPPNVAYITPQDEEFIYKPWEQDA